MHGHNLLQLLYERDAPVLGHDGEPCVQLPRLEVQGLVGLAAFGVELGGGQFIFSGEFWAGRESDQIVCGVGEARHLDAYVSEVRLYLFCFIIVYHIAIRQHKHPAKQVEDLTRRLVYRAQHCNSPSRLPLQQTHYLKGCVGVQATGGLIEYEEIRVCDDLVADGGSFLLTAGQTFHKHAAYIGVLAIH